MLWPKVEIVGCAMPKDEPRPEESKGVTTNPGSSNAVAGLESNLEGPRESPLLEGVGDLRGTWLGVIDLLACPPPAKPVPDDFEATPFCLLMGRDVAGDDGVAGAEDMGSGGHCQAIRAVGEDGVMARFRVPFGKDGPVGLPHASA